MGDIFAHSKEEKSLCNRALRCAAKFVESRVSTRDPQRIMTEQQPMGWTSFDDRDWRYAIGGHVSYGYARVMTTPSGFRMRFRWALEDTFTFRGKTAAWPHQFHRWGLAQDFWVTSRLPLRTFEWAIGEFQGHC